MGIINESSDRLKKNVEAMNRGEATHPVHAHMHVGNPPKARIEGYPIGGATRAEAPPKARVEGGREAGVEMYKRFYGGKKP